MTQSACPIPVAGRELQSGHAGQIDVAQAIWASVEVDEAAYLSDCCWGPCRVGAVSLRGGSNSSTGSSSEKSKSEEAHFADGQRRREM